MRKKQGRKRASETLHPLSSYLQHLTPEKRWTYIRSRITHSQDKLKTENGESTKLANTHSRVVSEGKKGKDSTDNSNKRNRGKKEKGDSTARS